MVFTNNESTRLTIFIRSKCNTRKVLTYSWNCIATTSFKQIKGYLLSSGLQLQLNKCLISIS